MAPKITVGISFKDAGEHFTLTLRSVFAQTFQDFELLLMDDGSTDGSLELARSLRDSRVRVYSDGLNKRSHIRGNELVRLARGEMFCIMDADDVMHPERLKTQYEHLKREQSPTVLGTQAFVIDQENRVIGIKQTHARQRRGFDARHSFINPTVMAPTAWFSRNPYSEEFAYHRSQDAELWCRAARTSRFVNLADPLLYYREIGVFSIDKYLSTSVGVLTALNEHFPTPRAPYICNVLKEVSKIWFKNACYAYGKIDMFVTSRVRPMTALQAERAAAGMVDVMRTPLPVG